MAKKETNQYLEIIKNARAKSFSPVYLLMGEESYFLDLICDAIEANALNETERDFDQTILYGADVASFSEVIAVARRYPMIAPRQLVMVKEAQNISDVDVLQYYLQQPPETTILVICYKHGSLKNQKIVNAAEKVGVVYEAKKLYDNQVVPFINSYVKEKRISIDPKAAQMLADFVGADLSRLTGELDKLHIAMGEGMTNITPEKVEECVGVSKDYNNFELLNALATRDVLKANRIVAHFERNQRNNPFVVTMSVLYNFFSNLMLCYYAPDKSERGLMAELGLRSTFQARDYSYAMRSYNAFKCIDIIRLLREYDARSKGIGNTGNVNDGMLLRELVYKIMH